jgi:hypothetical protein
MALRAGKLMWCPYGAVLFGMLREPVEVFFRSFFFSFSSIRALVLIKMDIAADAHGVGKLVVAFDHPVFAGNFFNLLGV